MVIFKGIIRGAYSEIQREFEKDAPAVLEFEGNTVADIVRALGIELDDWIFTIKEV